MEVGVCGRKIEGKTFEEPGARSRPNLRHCVQAVLGEDGVSNEARLVDAMDILPA